MGKKIFTVYVSNGDLDQNYILLADTREEAENRVRQLLTVKAEEVPREELKELGLDTIPLSSEPYLYDEGT